MQPEAVRPVAETTPPTELFAQALPLLPAVVRAACLRCRHFPRPEDVERFQARLCVLLLKDNAKVLRGYKGNAELKTWLQKIANHEVSRVLRWERQSVSLDDVPPERLVQPPEQEVWLLRKERQQLLQELLPKLPPRKRELAELALQGFSDEEIALEMGLKVETVYKRKSEALKSCVRLLRRGKKVAERREDFGLR
jgi:RNA polymerase sigma factor (sigma-70 family)